MLSDGEQSELKVKAYLTCKHAKERRLSQAAASRKLEVHPLP